MQSRLQRCVLGLQHNLHLSEAALACSYKVIQLDVPLHNKRMPSLKDFIELSNHNLALRSGKSIVSAATHECVPLLQLARGVSRPCCCMWQPTTAQRSSCTAVVALLLCPTAKG
jgi:hypothetical protein